MPPPLTGYAWWRSLGSPVRLVAPMVDASDLSFRWLARLYGAQLAYTPMLHARLAAEAAPSGLPRLGLTVSAGDRPLIAQIAGSEPGSALRAARALAGVADAVDLNLGCPQGIARRGRYGAFLLEDVPAAAAVVAALAGGLDVPVTAKVRLLPSWEASLAAVLALQEAGASLITVHGRRKEEIKERLAAADWDAIRRIKAHPAVRVPIVANGGIACHADVQACLDATGADAVMVSEALLENPGLFTDGVMLDAQALRAGGTARGDAGVEAAAAASAAAAAAASPAARRRSDALDYAFEYLDIAAYFDESTSAVRGHLMKILFAPLKIDPRARNDVLRSHSFDDWRAVLMRLARTYRHPRALAADTRALDTVRALVEAAVAEAAVATAPPPASLAPHGGARRGGGGGGGTCPFLRPRPPAVAAAEAARLSARAQRSNAKKEQKAAKKAQNRAVRAAAAAVVASGGGDAALAVCEAGVCAGAGAVDADAAAATGDGNGDGIGGSDVDGDDGMADVSISSSVVAAAGAPPSKRPRQGTPPGDAADAPAAGGTSQAPAAAAAAAALVGSSDATCDAAAAASAAAEAAAAVQRNDRLVEATDWGAFVGSSPSAADAAEWLQRRLAAPNAGLCPPAFLVDPLAPGLWYMRHQPDVYGRGPRRDGAAAFLEQLERPGNRTTA